MKIVEFAKKEPIIAIGIGIVAVLGVRYLMNKNGEQTSSVVGKGRCGCYDNENPPKFHKNVPCPCSKFNEQLYGTVAGGGSAGGGRTGRKISAIKRRPQRGGFISRSMVSRRRR